MNKNQLEENMNIVKEISFLGSFQKADIEDNQKIENINAIIYCCANGKLLLKTNESVVEKINKKFFFETIDTSNDKKNIATPGYQGYYSFQGKTSDGYSLLITILLENISVKFTSYSIDSNQDKQQFLEAILIKLKINYESIQDDYQVKKITYGLSNLRISQQLHSNFLDNQASFVFKPLKKQDKQTLDAELTGELTISNLSKKEDYQLYLYWIQLVLSFASGDKSYCIYEKVTWENDVETEHWYGGRAKARQKGLTIIEIPNFRNFAQQVSNSIKPEIFGGKDLGGLSLGLAIHWYLENIASNTLQTRFICLCTAFEVLISSFKKTQNSSNNSLISKGKKRKIRKQIKEVLNTNRDKPEEVSQENIQNYELFCKTMEDAIDYANKIDRSGSFSENSGGLLDYYNVYYKDLFSQFDFVKIRNEIVHQGFSKSDQTLESFFKLKILFIRLVLSMLTYQGNYLEFDGKESTCKSLPMSQSNSAT